MCSEQVGAWFWLSGRLFETRLLLVYLCVRFSVNSWKPTSKAVLSSKFCFSNFHFINRCLNMTIWMNRVIFATFCVYFVYDFYTNNNKHYFLSLKYYRFVKQTPWMWLDKHLSLVSNRSSQRWSSCSGMYVEWDTTVRIQYFFFSFVVFFLCCLCYHIIWWIKMNIFSCTQYYSLIGLRSKFIMWL